MQTPLLPCSLEKSKKFEYKLDIDDIKKLLILLGLVKTIPSFFFLEIIFIYLFFHFTIFIGV